MRLAPAVILLGALVMGSEAGAAAPKPSPLPNPHGWGKLNISYLQFRTDTVECGYQASQVKMTDIVGNAPSLPTVVAAAPPVSAGAATSSGISRDALDMLESYTQNLQQYTMGVENRVEARVQAAVDQCLKDRGYRPFRMTAEQMSRLRRYKKGTRERYQLIYALGTDPGVLSNQGL